MKQISLTMNLLAAQWRRRGIEMGAGFGRMLAMILMAALVMATGCGKEKAADKKGPHARTGEDELTVDVPVARSPLATVSVDLHACDGKGRDWHFLPREKAADLVAHGHFVRVEGVCLFVTGRVVSPGSRWSTRDLAMTAVPGELCAKYDDK